MQPIEIRRYLESSVRVRAVPTTDPRVLMANTELRISGLGFSLEVQQLFDPSGAVNADLEDRALKVGIDGISVALARVFRREATSDPIPALPAPPPPDPSVQALLDQLALKDREISDLKASYDSLVLSRMGISDARG